MSCEVRRCVCKKQIYPFCLFFWSKNECIIHNNASSSEKKHPLLSSHQNIPTYLFWTVLLINGAWSAYFSPEATIWNKKCLDGFVSYKHIACGLLTLPVDYYDVFISHLDSQFDDTHSLQKIHWWVSDVMLHFPKSVQMNKQTHVYLYIYIWVKCEGLNL